MGGCATKPKVFKDDDTAAPEPQPEPKHVKEDTVQTKVKETKQPQQQGGGGGVNVNVDDDQETKQRSLSLLFNKQNDEDAEVSTGNKKTEGEETSKQQTLEALKPLVDTESSEPELKHESPKTDEKPYQETKNNEPLEDAIIKEPELKHESSKTAEKPSEETKIDETVTNQETDAVFVDAEEKPSLQNQSAVPATEVTVQIETPEEAKKTSEGTIINEPSKETAAKQNQNANAAETTEKNEDAKVSTENVKTIAEETVKQETLEAEKPFVDAITDEPTMTQEILKIEEKLSTKQEPALVVDAVKQETKQAEKPLEDAITNESTMKQESAKIEEKLSKETKNNEPATKQEPAAVVVDAAKQEITEADKSFEDAITNDQTLKQESRKIEEKLSEETKNNEPATKQENAEVFVDAAEKPLLQNQTIVPAEETVKTEAPKEAKKTSEETKINEPAVVNLVKQNKSDIAAEVAELKIAKPAVNFSKGTESNELNEPIKQEKLSEIQPVEDVVFSLPREKVTEVLLKNADSVENKAVKETSKASV